MKKILKPITMPYFWQCLLLAIPRIICGYLLTRHFGADKFGMPWSPPDKNLKLFEVAFWFPGDVAQYGGLFAMAPAIFAWLAGFAEAVGGLLLAIGLFTRVSALLILGTMLVAIFAQQINDGMWATLPALGFMWVSLYCLVIGSGKFGIDYILTKNNNNE
jgi:putative oxidoreductase